MTVPPANPPESTPTHPEPAPASSGHTAELPATTVTTVPVAPTDNDQSTDDDRPTEAIGASPTPGARHRERDRRALIVHLLVLLLFLGVAAAVVGTNVHRSPGMAIFDETTHADYAYRISHGQIPAKGGVLAPEIRREAACHGKSVAVVTLPPCNLQVVPPASAFAVGGQDYNFGHPPVYYLITGYLARLGEAIHGGSGHFITLARLVGIGWLAAAMFVLYLALRRFRVPTLIAVTGGLFLVACPSVAYACSIITNDAVAPLGGALALYFMARALVDRQVRPIPLFLAAALITGTKVINSLPFLALAGMFAIIALVAWRTQDRSSPEAGAEKRAQVKTYLIGAIAIGLGVLIVYKGWSVFQSGRGQANWVNPIKGISGRPYHGLPFDEWGTTLFSGFPPTVEYFLPPVLDGKLMVLWQRVLPVVMGAATLGLVIVFRRGDYRWQLGATLIAALIAFPIVVQIQVLLDTRLYFPLIPARYGMSLIPWCVAALAIIAAWRPFTRIFIALTLAGIVLTMGSFLGYG